MDVASLEPSVQPDTANQLSSGAHAMDIDSGPSNVAAPAAVTVPQENLDRSQSNTPLESQTVTRQATEELNNGISTAANTPIHSEPASVVKPRIRFGAGAGSAGVGSGSGMGSITTSSKGAAKPVKKLQLKVGRVSTGQNSFLGPYDRELDSSDDELFFEEQFFLRMPTQSAADRLRAMVRKREVGDDVWFKFKDGRRAIFNLDKTMYSAKLVDMPTITEGCKSLDNKNLFKVADICQMLVVEEPIASESVVNTQVKFSAEDYIWPHGLTPPLRHVRQRRFRKRADKHTIESVEEAVKDLLEKDGMTKQVEWHLYEGVDPNLSDSEFLTPEPGSIMTTPRLGQQPASADAGQQGSAAQKAQAGADGDDDAGGAGEGAYDEALAREIDREMGARADEEEEEEEEERGDGDESSDDDDLEEGITEAAPGAGDNEATLQHKLLQEEIKDVEAAIAKKRAELETCEYAIVRKRHEDSLRKLVADLELKKAQLEREVHGVFDEELEDEDMGDEEEEEEEAGESEEEAEGGATETRSKRGRGRRAEPGHKAEGRKKPGRPSKAAGSDEDEDQEDEEDEDEEEESESELNTADETEESEEFDSDQLSDGDEPMQSDEEGNDDEDADEAMSE